MPREQGADHGCKPADDDAVRARARQGQFGAVGTGWGPVQVSLLSWGEQCGRCFESVSVSLRTALTIGMSEMERMFFKI